MKKLTNRINNRKDLLLILLYSPGVGDEPNEPISGRTRIIKMLFLFKMELLPIIKNNVEVGEDNFYQFFAWNFGPFSTEVMDDIDFFRMRNFIKASPEDEELLPEEAAEFARYQEEYSIDEDMYHEYEDEIFSLTSKGEKFSRSIYTSLTEPQKKTIREFKRKMNSSSLRAILRYVYKTYPQMTDKSVIKEDVLR